MPIEDKAIEEAAKTARHYLDGILLAPLAEFGLLIRDTVSFWRFKNQVNMVGKAKKLLEAKGIDAKTIAGSVLPENVIPLIEAGSETSNPTLSDLFASLLATAINPKTAASVHPSFGKILNQLAPLDAQILVRLKNEIDAIQLRVDEGSKIENMSNKIPLYRQFQYDAQKLSLSIDRSFEEVNLCFENLRRLGICDRGGGQGGFLSQANQEPVIVFTDFGMRFLKACMENLAG